LSEVARAVLPAFSARFRRFLTILGEVSTAVLTALAARFRRFLAVLGEVSAAVLSALPALVAGVGSFLTIVGRVLILCHVGRVLSVSCYPPFAMANSEDRIFPAFFDIVPFFRACNVI
jgi:hypothetical protein